MKLKYVIDEFKNVALNAGVASHDEIGRTLHGKNVSAGFCTLVGYHHDGMRFEVSCWGKSSSLDLVAREKEDAEIITNRITKHPYDQ